MGHCKIKKKKKVFNPTRFDLFGTKNLTEFTTSVLE